MGKTDREEPNFDILSLLPALTNDPSPDDTKMDRIATRRLLALSAATRTRATALAPRSRHVRANSTLPTIAEPGFWSSLVPKPFRRSADHGAKSKKKSKEWNPATFFIVIFLLIGSMSINTIAVKNDRATFVRQSDVRIGLLREVVEKLQRGEEVDVEQALGTGDPAREKEWEESKMSRTSDDCRSHADPCHLVLREIEMDNAIRDSRKPKKPKTSEDSTAKAVPTPEPSSAAEKPRVSSSSFY